MVGKIHFFEASVAYPALFTRQMCPMLPAHGAVTAESRVDKDEQRKLEDEGRKEKKKEEEDTAVTWSVFWFHFYGYVGSSHQMWQRKNKEGAPAPSLFFLCHI